MKRTFIISILLLFLIIPALAQEESFNKRQLAPPQWILGIWSDNDDNIGYAFQEDDVRQLFTSYPSFMKLAATGQAMVDVDTATAQQFSFYFLVPEAGAVQHYDFIKKTETTLDYYMSTNKIKRGPVELRKR